MFNFFKKDNFSRKIPDDYKHLMDQRAYGAMLDTILQYFKEKGEQVLKIDGRYIFTKEASGKGLQHQYGLDNLVRTIATTGKEDMKPLIIAHFNKMQIDMRPLEYFMTDYESAKEYLKILIKPHSVLTERGGNDAVYKVMLPGTCSMLVFDYDNKFTYLYHKMIKEWNKTTDELFDEALYNISNEEISITGLNFNSEKEGDDIVENSDAFVFESGDFAAPAIILIENKAPFAIGKYGSIVAIPSKGYAISAPINNGKIIEKISPLSVIVLKFFNEQPGSITTDLYWYYKERFHLLPETLSEEKEGYLAIVLPQELLRLINDE